MHVPPSVQAVCWFVFDPKSAAVNDLNSVWSSTSLFGTSVAYRYRKSISIIELFVSIISIYTVSGSWQLIFSDLYRILPGGR